MAEASAPSDVKLICGMISADVALFDAAEVELAAAFSEIDLRSEIMPFDFTHYYDAQMGSPLWRQFVSFSKPVSPEMLAAAKTVTNRIEADFARGMGILPMCSIRRRRIPPVSVSEQKLQQQKRRNSEDMGRMPMLHTGETPVPRLGRPARPINLDVGYVDESKLILASMKNFSHRVYLAQGVYAELTLMYHKGRWDALGWTFPDFASGRYHAFLTQARDKLRQHLIRHRKQHDGAAPEGRP